jgi:hypothetical protein
MILLCYLPDENAVPDEDTAEPRQHDGFSNYNPWLGGAVSRWGSGGFVRDVDSGMLRQGCAISTVWVTYMLRAQTSSGKVHGRCPSLLRSWYLRPTLAQL